MYRKTDVNSSEFYRYGVSSLYYSYSIPDRHWIKYWISKSGLDLKSTVAGFTFIEPGSPSSMVNVEYVYQVQK